MSLVVWLPLNGDLHNQGLNNNIITETVVFNDKGKIGSCLESTSVLDLKVPQSIYDVYSVSNTEISYCLWVKIDKAYLNNLISTTDFSTKTQIYNKIMGFNNGTTSNGIGLHLKTNTGLTQSSVLNTIFLYGWLRNGSFSKGSTAIEINLDQWYHLCVTYDKLNVFNFYINGSLIASTTINRVNLNTSISNKAVVLNSQTCELSSSSSVNVHLLNLKEYINDVRIYNHALSSKEVEEIAKGLVLHYKLDYMNLINKDTLTNNAYINTNGTTTSTSGWFATDFIPVSSNHSYQTYKLSSGGSNTCIAFYNNAKVKTRTITMIANQDNTLIPESTETFVRLSIRNFANELKTALFYEIPTTIYDSSGYSHNGTVIGSLTAAAGSPRYDVATVFDGSSTIAAGRDAMVKDAITVGCWGYMENWSNYTHGMRLISCTESGGWTFYWDGGKICCYLGTGTSSNTYKYIGSNTTWASLSTGWHYFVLTYDGFIGKFYLDGNENASVTAYTTKTPLFYHSSNGIFIGAEAVKNLTTATEFFNGKLSDVRIYATALTAAQVKELYNTSMSVDSNGNVYARELNEL